MHAPQESNASLESRLKTAIYITKRAVDAALGEGYAVRNPAMIARLVPVILPDVAREGDRPTVLPPSGPGRSVGYPK